jgi:YHS domain-containing protein
MRERSAFVIDLAYHADVLDDGSISVGYDCPCGCTPAVTYSHGAAATSEGCCCGNEMVVGPDAHTHLASRPGYELKVVTVTAPWAEVPVAWAIGPSTHPDEHDHDATPATTEIDPVCGMAVDPEAARGKALHIAYKGTDYFFCGKGCKLDFEEDPERYLAPGYVPSM